MFMNECLRKRMSDELNSIYYQSISNVNEDHITPIFVMNIFAHCTYIYLQILLKKATLNVIIFGTETPKCQYNQTVASLQPGGCISPSK